ncbi:UPF0259 membrane protein YciC [Candidatus Erwinia haradaeae]|uniref:UPF0259 membrane protein ERCILAFE3058_491 n=1 Tax=Candidatus Erwinia haradaeae TaxID=1922217 RepID=A0A451DDB7_9GAMM|nr:YciC family protein [Candidatus Erwinia haradaeae]VFP84403.1 UPF0259 membrane protein YciC [Candidatus Erwinia haradaeae]
MLITASALYRDTGNFFRHQLLNIALIAVFTSCVMIIVSKILMPSVDEMQVFGDDLSVGVTRSLLDIVRNMSPEQQKILLRISAAGTLSSLIGNALLLGGMLSLIKFVSSGKQVSALHAFIASLPDLINLLPLTFFMMLLIQIGFMILVVPGVLLSVTLALSPIIITTEKVGVITAIYTSSQICWSHVKLIFPVVMIWILAKILILALASVLVRVPTDLAILLLNILSNFVSAVLIIYLSRLYMLLH